MKQIIRKSDIQKSLTVTKALSQQLAEIVKMDDGKRAEEFGTKGPSLIAARLNEELDILESQLTLNEVIDLPVPF